MLNIIIARKLGVEGSGYYYLTLSVVTAAVVIGRFGMDLAAMRHVSYALASENTNTVPAIFRRSFVFILSVSSLLAAITYFFAQEIALHFFQKAELTEFIRLGVWAIPAMSLVFLFGELLRSVNEIRQSQLVNFALNPFVAIMLLISLGVFMDVSLELTIVSYIAGAYVSLLFGFYFWRQKQQRFAQDVADTTSAPFTSDLVQAALPMFMVTFIGFLSNWGSITLLGVFGDKQEVGLFSVALRTAFVATFFMKAFGIAVAPKYAKLYRKNDMAGLEKVTKKTTRLMLIITAPVLLIMIFFSEFIMGLYGAEFAQGGTCLAILAVGHLVNVGVGNVGFLLMMTGHEKTIRNNNFVGVGIIVLLSITLIPFFGAVGAASGYVSGVIIQNILACISVKRRLGFLTF